MDEDDDGPQVKARVDPNAGPAMGPVYLLWESCIEKLKILNYEKDYCKRQNRKILSRVHFVVPGSNSSHQFDEFIGISAWLCLQITKKTDTFKPEEFDDPNTIVNKLMLALRQFDFRSSFPPQKLKVANGEAVCSVLDFLADKALAARSFQWSTPVYQDLSGDDQNEEMLDPAESDDIQEDVAEEVEDEFTYEEPSKLDSSLDASAHHILQAVVDPVEWKTELERVGPKLRSNVTAGANEWRSHVDQTLTSKGHIEKVLSETQGDLQILNKQVADELNKMRMKEKYLSNQYNALGLEYIDVKHKLEELESKSSANHEVIAKLTSELSEISEKLDDMKESFESKDSGLHDTSPLVKIKSALQQVKAEIHLFDLRIGVVSHSLLAARVLDTNRLRSQAISKSRKRHQKKKAGEDANLSD